MRTHTLVAIGIVGILCGSCGSGYHLRRAAHHINKAKEKGALIDRDTIYVHDTTYVKSFESDTVFKQVNFTDTLVHETTRTIIKVKINYKDREVFVKTYVKPDTLVKTILVPCEQVLTRPNYWPLLIFIAVLLAVLVMWKSKK